MGRNQCLKQTIDKNKSTIFSNKQDQVKSAEKGGGVRGGREGVSSYEGEEREGEEM